MSNSETSTDSQTQQTDAQFDHFNPFAGLVDLNTDEVRNIRYGFIVCGIRLVFEQSLICEVIQYNQVYTIPNTPSWLRGLINLRGNLIPVFNLYDYWNNENENNKLPLIVFGSGDDAFGLYADAFPQSLEIEDETPKIHEINANIPEDLKPYLKHAYQLNNDDWYEADIIGFIRHLSSDYADSKDDVDLP